MTWLLAMSVALATDPAWCHRELWLSDDDMEWCSDVPPGCPSLLQACAQERAAKELKAAEAPAGGCNGDPESKAGRPSSRRREPIVIEVPAVPGVPPLASGAAGWVVLAAVLVAVCLALLWRRGEEAVGSEPPDAPGHASDDAADERRLVGTQAGGWREAAERAARAGRFDEALLIARGAVVRALEARGVVVPDPSRTDRELIRSLLADVELHRSLKTLLGALERVRYARAPLDALTVDRALSAAVRIVAGGLALLCTSAAWAGPAGNDLLADFLAREGIVVERSDGFQPDAAYQIWSPNQWATDDDVTTAVDAARAGSTVFVFGGSLPRRLSAAGLADDGEATLPIRGVPGMAGRMVWPPVSLPSGARRLVSAGEDGPVVRPLLRDALGGVVAAELVLDDGLLIVVASDCLLDNAGLLHRQNADTLLGVLSIPDGAAVTLVSPALASATAAETLLAAGFGVGFFQLAALWAIWAWSAGRRFARPQELLEHPPRAFASHLAAVARFYRSERAPRPGWLAVARRGLARLRQLTGSADAQLADSVVARLGENPATERMLVERALAATRTPPDANELWLTEEFWKLINRLQATTPGTSRSNTKR